MCKRLEHVRVRRSKYPLSLLLISHSCTFQMVSALLSRPDLISKHGIRLRRLLMTGQPLKKHFSEVIGTLTDTMYNAYGLTETAYVTAVLCKAEGDFDDFLVGYTHLLWGRSPGAGREPSARRERGDGGGGGQVQGAVWRVLPWRAEHTEGVSARRLDSYRRSRSPGQQRQAVHVSGVARTPSCEAWLPSTRTPLRGAWANCPRWKTWWWRPCRTWNSTKKSAHAWWWLPEVT